MDNLIISKLINTCITECKKKKNMCVIENDILEPLIIVILDKIRPYILATSIFFIVIIISIISIIILLLLLINNN